ncbi:hypothetical protein V6N13_074278 [Hibiscus sabdariffa]
MDILKWARLGPWCALRVLTWPVGYGKHMGFLARASSVHRACCLGLIGHRQHMWCLSRAHCVHALCKLGPLGLAQNMVCLFRPLGARPSRSRTDHL